MKGAGGTSGGLLSFFMGVVMASGGGYMLTQTVTVRFGQFFSFFGGQGSFGLALVLDLAHSFSSKGYDT